MLKGSKFFTFRVLEKVLDVQENKQEVIEKCLPLKDGRKSARYFIHLNPCPAE